MKLGLTSEQVLAMAPDAGAVSAGRGLARVPSWLSLGQSEEALWGECKGSALYQVRVERATFSVACTCPSRKRPCKHGLGLLLLAADPSELIPQADPPGWVASWLEKREQAQAKKTKTGGGEPTSGHNPARAEKRAALVRQGVDRLRLFLSDALSRGLLALGEQPSGFWEDQAARLVDAQAPGLASLVRRLGALDRSSPDWPDRLLDQMGRLALLLQAYERLDALEDGLREDVRQLVGWTLGQDEVRERGELVADEWMIAGSRVDAADRMFSQRTWLYGRYSGRTAMILQYSSGGQAFAEVYPPGMRQHAEVAYWPGACAQRALLVRRRGEMQPVEGALSAGLPSVDAFLEQVSAALGRQPWLERFLCPVAQASPLLDEQEGRWYLRDGQGLALPLSGPPWELLALSGGAAVDVLSEWDGGGLSPLGVFVGGLYSVLHPVDSALLASRPSPPEKRNPFAASALTGISAGQPLRTGTSADDLLASLEGETPAETLLLRAGAWAVYRDAGYASRSLADASCEQAPPELAAAVTEQVVRRLVPLLQFGEGDPLELLQEVWALGQRLPHGLLPRALARATSESRLREATAAVLGARGGWLARLNPDWRWALSPVPS